jgi:hypothetical protein
MSRAAILWLLFAGRLSAQTMPAPEIGLDVNADRDAVVSLGWPLLIRAAVISADGSPLIVGLSAGDWTQSLHLTITDQSGKAQTWPLQLVPPSSGALNLSGFTNAEAVWLVAPEATASIPAGVYNLAVTLDTTSGAADGTWVGSVTGSGASVQLQPEPASLSSEDEATKYLAIAAYTEFQGDLQGAAAAMDTLIARQPGTLMAYTRKADLLGAGGDYTGALGLYQQTLAMFQANNPDASEPLTLFTKAMADLSAKLAGQQSDAAGAIRNMVAGDMSPVIAPDAIVTAYGARLAATTASAADYSAVSLGGTTVTIADSSGASFVAQLLFVSPNQVRYVAPSSLALGAATVTLTTPDGSKRRGAVTVVDVQPGLVAARRGRLNSGRNILEIDATGIRRAVKDQVKVTVGGVPIPVRDAGPVSGSAGLDRIEVELPPTLAGRGDAPVVLMVAGKQSNSARIANK